MNWNTNENVWLANGELYLFFRDLKDNDKSLSQERSSIKLWACLLMNHSDSPLKEMLAEEKVIILQDSFIRSKKTDIETYYKEECKFQLTKKNVKSLSVEDLANIVYSPENDSLIIDRIVNISYPRYKKLLKDWEDKLEERRTFIKSIPYTREDVDMLEKIGSQTAKLWVEFFRIKKMAEDEQATVRGGEELSFLEEMED
jgi:hypothetical protein